MMASPSLNDLLFKTFSFRDDDGDEIKVDGILRDQYSLLVDGIYHAWAITLKPLQATTLDAKYVYIKVQ